MLLPLMLILLAAGSSAVVAYGVHPDLAQYANGIGAIMLSRRLMWPMIALSIGLCVALLALVISGKRRTWWLIGLAPVLALFVVRFAPGSAGPAGVVESPAFVTATDANVLESGDYVVGLVFQDRAYAFPYRALYVTPVVALTDYDKRLLLMWSAYANRAVAVSLNREMKPRDLEVVSSPANSLLVYDRRLGQFISGVTGKRVDGRDTIGFGQRIGTEKMPWAAWKSRHPDTYVMVGARHSDSPNRPILPQYRMHIPPSPDPGLPIAMLTTTQPAAVPENIVLNSPANLSVGATRVLLVRTKSGRLRAFDRHVKEDLFLTFSGTLPAKQARKFPDAVLSDADTQTLWTLDGRALDGPLKGEHLTEIDLDAGLYWGVMKFWYPRLELIQ